MRSKGNKQTRNAPRTPYDLPRRQHRQGPITRHAALQVVGFELGLCARGRGDDGVEERGGWKGEGERESGVGEAEAAALH